MKTMGIPLVLGLFLMPISAFMVITSLIGTPDKLQCPIAITLLLVANVLFLSADFTKNVLFLTFQGTYFLFLIAGPLLDAIDGIDFFISFSAEVVRKTYVCYWIAAFAMWIYCLYKANNGPAVVFIGKTRGESGYKRKYNLERIRICSKILFYISIIAYIAVTLDKILFRQFYSLQAYYATYSASSNLPGLVIKIADCHLISLAMFLATKPAKREAKLPLIVFMIASLLTLLYGVRNVFILNALFLLIYFVFRNGDNGEIWLPRRTVAVGVILSPICMVLLQAFDMFRRSIAFNVFDIKELFSFSLVKDFFVSQSVSSYILPNAIVHFSQLGGQPVPYTFGTLYTYLQQNMIVRFFTGVPAFSSNSIESAMSSGNLGARLAYNMYRETFLSGTGMGGSFVADLFVDFSYIGVFAGALLLCVIMNKITNKVKNGGGGQFSLYSGICACSNQMVCICSA